MSIVPTTIRGYVAALPSGQPCRVALVAADNGEEYPILPRGAGIDLGDMVSAPLEVACIVHEDGGTRLLHVRSYHVLDVLDDEEAWYGEA